MFLSIFGDLGTLVTGIAVGVVVGHLLARRSQPTPTNDDRRAWLDQELTSGSLSTMLPETTLEDIRATYGLPGRTATPATPGDPSAAESPVPAPASIAPPASRAMAPQVVPAHRMSEAAPSPASPVVQDPDDLRETLHRDVARVEPAKDPFSWDPAVLLLYLGAFLVVASGLVYASYNWADLGAWQKLGMLMALTIAFAGGGWLLLGIERVKEAARTFVAIGALLVPANAIAAATVFDRDAASPALITLLGSLATALLHGLFSIRPGGRLYSYGAAIAATLAIAALVPAFGPAPVWGSLTVLAAAALAPNLLVRLGNRLEHLHRPMMQVLGVATVPAILAGIAGWAENHWLPTLALILATIAFGRIALHYEMGVTAIAGAITMALIAPAVLLAADPDSPAVYAWGIAVAAVAFVGVAQYLPPWSSQRLPRTAIHAESAIGFALAGLIGSFSTPWQAPVLLAIGAIATGAISMIRHSRWWWLICSGFIAGAWFAIPGWDRYDDWDALATFRFAIPAPLLLAALAIGIGWWANRDAATDRGGWSIPPWIAAGAMAVAITLAGIGNDSLTGNDPGLRLIAVAAALYAAIALIAAWRLHQPSIRIAYAIWATLALGLITVTLPVQPAGQALIGLGAASIAALASMPGMPAPLGSPRSAPDDSSQLSTGAAWGPSVVFGLAGMCALLVMLGYTAVYVGTRETATVDELPDGMWIWYAYLATFAAFAAGSAWTGVRLGRDPHAAAGRANAAFITVTLGFGTVAALLMARMITTDRILWTRAGIVVAIVILAGATATRNRETGNAFLSTLFPAMTAFACGLGAISIAANLLLVADDPSRASDWSEAITFGLAGLAILVLAWWRVSPWLGGSGLGLVAIAVIFAAQTRNDPAIATPVGLVILSWLAMGSTIAIQRSSRGALLGPSWRITSIGVGLAAIAAAIIADPNAGPGSSGWQTITFTLIMAAALVATEGWLRQDRRWVIGASVLAMAALFLQIGAREPSNIQGYTAPLALYLLALGYISRRTPSLRDVLLALGSIALLLPPLLQAQVDSDVRQLLVAGIEALVLFVAGVFLRQRVAVAAGVGAISLIVLRFLVDAAIALPGWISLLAGGLLLLLIGTILTVWKDELRTRLDRLQAGWHEMG